MKYRLSCDDNFHFMDANERDTCSGYDSAGAAIAAAKAIVDRYLQWEYRPGMSADELYDYYTSFGDDPFIRTDDPKCVFSAWTYTEQRCKEICAAAKGDSKKG